MRSRHCQSRCDGGGGLRIADTATAHTDDNRNLTPNRLCPDMEPPGAETVVVRYGDMSTKSSRVRRGMEERLVENIEALLEDRGVEIGRAHV